MKKSLMILFLIMLPIGAQAFILAGVLGKVPTYVPNAVTALTATAGNAQNTVTWTNSAVDGSHSAATSYNLLRSTTSGAETLVTSGVSSGVIDTGLTNGTGYYYKVNAINSAGTTTSAEAGPFTPSAGTTYTAQFASSTIDSGFTSISSGSATVTSNSPSGYVTLANTATSSGSAIIWNTALASNKVFTIKVKGKINSGAGGGGFEVAVVHDTVNVVTGAPAGNTNAQLSNKKSFVMQLNAGLDNWLIQYMSNGNDQTPTRWNGTTWSTSGAWAGTATRGTEYIFIIESNGTQIRATIKAADDTTVITQTPWVNWSSVVDSGSGSYWLYAGDPTTDAYYSTSVIDYIQVTQ
jgi:hypothetical protein